MRKDQLIKALLTAARIRAVKIQNAKKVAAPARRSATAKRPATAVVAAGNRIASQSVVRSNIARTNGVNGNGRSLSGASTNGHSNGSATNGTANGRSLGANGAEKRPSRPSTNGHAAARPAAPLRKPSSPRVVKHIQQAKDKLDRSKNLSLPGGSGKRKAHVRDRIVVMVRDSYWLHVYWELARQSVERAQAAMGQDWHMARPCLRLLEISEGGATNASERVVEDITIHGGVSNWYLHVNEPPKSYRIEIGYLAASGRFFALSRSNVVTTPPPGTSDAIDEHWAGVAEDFDKIYAMSGGYSAEGSNHELQELFEERLRRPMGSPMMTRYGEGIEGLFPGRGNFRLEVDAELIVYGVTEANSHVSLKGEPVRLRPDGSFTVRMSLPNQRQVIPVVASAANGGEQRTIVLAIERNTKVMEPILRESND
jgi:uncharacterized protein